ncbi:MAG: hypothetical protein Q27BPR15_01105 [Rhodobacter sp. CACIA14H1]|nr:MAG: hypothetical protein Q27BPR15_01105 [Rhodobacter sp. CACIA14H1]
MSITSAIVLYAVCWFMTFFVVLPLRFVSQGDAGEVVPGTPKGAPATHIVARKAKMTTWIAALVWLLLAGIITSGVIGVRDIDMRGVMSD